MKKILLPVLALLVITACGANKKDSEKVNAEPSEVVIAPAQAVADTTADERGYLVKVGEMAPDFTMTLDNGQVVKLSECRGKVVMLQFTASWCGVCRKEMPFIEKDIWQKYKDNKDFVLWGIDRDEPLETVKEFATQTGVTYPLGLDPGADIFAMYALRKAGITRNVVIDRDGRIVMLTRLFNDEEFNAMCAEIEKLLNK